MNSFNIIFFSFLFVLLSSCQLYKPRRPLTMKEIAVKIAKNDQETTLKLNDKCKANGQVETYYHIDDVKIRAAEKEVDTAQIIYARNNNGTNIYDVRFWNCR